MAYNITASTVKNAIAKPQNYKSVIEVEGVKFQKKNGVFQDPAGKTLQQFVIQKSGGQGGTITPVNTPQSFPNNPSATYNMPTNSQSAFDMSLRNILYNRLAAKGDIALQNKSKEAIGSLKNIYPELTATEGFGNLNLGQARQLEQLKRGGYQDVYSGVSGALSNRQRRLEELGGYASNAFNETIQMKAAEQQAKQKQRDDAIDEFLSFRQDLVQKGIPLSNESGQKFMNELLTSDNPQQVLNDYYVAASQNPAVVQAYKKKGGGGGGGGSALDKESGDVPLSDEYLEGIAQSYASGELDVESATWKSLSQKQQYAVIKRANTIVAMAGEEPEEPSFLDQYANDWKYGAKYYKDKITDLFD